LVEVEDDSPLPKTIRFLDMLDNGHMMPISRPTMRLSKSIEEDEVTTPKYLEQMMG
jgi:hypothetical protein